MSRSRTLMIASSALVMTSLLAIPASAWGPHPEVDAAHAHLVQLIEEMDHIEKINPHDSFGGHMGEATRLARRALDEFDKGVAVRSQLP
jgi:hypothetical protein